MKNKQHTNFYTFNKCDFTRVAMLNTGLLTKLGFKPVVMYFMRNYATKLIPVRQRKGWKRAPLFDFINNN